jgi:hypothetical protein
MPSAPTVLHVGYTHLAQLGIDVVRVCLFIQVFDCGKYV